MSNQVGQDRRTLHDERPFQFVEVISDQRELLAVQLEHIRDLHIDRLCEPLSDAHLCHFLQDRTPARRYPRSVPIECVVAGVDGRITRRGDLVRNAALAGAWRPTDPQDSVDEATHHASLPGFATGAHRQYRVLNAASRRAAARQVSAYQNSCLAVALDQARHGARRGHAVERLVEGKSANAKLGGASALIERSAATIRVSAPSRRYCTCPERHRRHGPRHE